MTARRDPEPLLAHAGWVRTLALQLCADVHAAEDAAQDTLAAVLRRPPEDPERARGFLTRTLHNVLAMSARSNRRRTRREQLAALPADAAVVDASELVARAELHRQLVVAVLALPEAWRELVLRHYFEGADTTALARRARISPDAVRAQLRRARERLRAELERDGGEPARAFALLVAASRPVVKTASTTSAALSSTVASAAAVGTIMKLKLLFGVAAVIAAVCFLLPQLGPATTAAVPAAPTTTASVAVAEAVLLDAADAAPAPQARTEVPPPTGLVLGGQLAGLHPEVPWTASLVLRATGRVADAEHEHEAPLAVAADGTFDMVLPAWSRQGTLELRLVARDPFYLPVDVRFGSDVRTRKEPISVNVEPASVVVGRVVDPHGAAVPAARVGAFLPTSDRFRGEVFMRCSTNTDANGNYRLQVPMATAVLLLALPMHEASPSGNGPITADGAITDNGVHRDDLMPASVRVLTRWGKVTEAPELRLVEPAWVTGSVTTGDGAPRAGVEVIWIHNTADGPSLYDRSLGNLMIWSDGSMGRIARARTDANGRFRLPATPGKTGACYPLDDQRRREPSVEMVTATPPAELGFRLDGGVALVRVLCGGLPVPGVRVVTDSIGDRLTPSDRKRQTDANGEVRFLRSKGVSQQVTIERPGDVAREVEIPADASAAKPFVIELPRLPTAPVQLEFEAASRVRQVELTWNRHDAEVVPLQLNRSRDDSEGPFRLDVPEGRYELIVRAPSRGERRDTFPLETKYEVEVPMSGRDLKLPIAHGGRIKIIATDADGGYAGGFVSITGSAGRFDWMNSWQEPRDSPNVPAGTYELRFERREQCVHQSTVEVRACEVTEVRIRLP